LPADKVQELEVKLSSMQHRYKVTLRQMQSLIGSLNFACRAVVAFISGSLTLLRSATAVPFCDTFEGEASSYRGVAHLCA
jgi:hypothetical protein